MKINKRKKSKDKQIEDKLKLHDSAPVIEAEDDELFLEELFANEENASAVTIPEPKARSVEAHDVKKAKKHKNLSYLCLKNPRCAPTSLLPEGT